MANITFMESGTDATGDLSFWPVTSGTVASDTSNKNTGARSIKCTSGGSGAVAYVQSPSSVISLASGVGLGKGRVSFWVRLNSLPSATLTILQLCSSNFGTSPLNLRVTTGGVLQLFDSAGTQIGSNGGTLSTGTWYRIALTVVAGTPPTLAVFLNGSTTIGPTTMTGTAGQDTCVFGWATASAGNSLVVNFDDIYIDDDATGADPGEVHVVALAPAATNTNSFDTTIGSATNRYDYVSEVPISESKGFQHAATSDVQENYGLPSQSTAGLSGNTILGRTAWLWGKRGALPTVLKNSVANQAKASGTTLTLGALSTAVGDVMVVWFGDQLGSTAPTIADNLGNTWTQMSGGPKTNTVRCTGWYATVASGKSGSTTVTITFPSSSNARAGIFALIDAGVVGIKDKDITWVNDSTTPYDCPSTGTLVQANEVVIGLVAYAGNDALSAGSSDNFVNAINTTGAGATTNVSVGMTYRSVNATTAVAPQMTGTSRAGVCGTISFKLSTDCVSFGTPKIMDNGTETSITLTGVSALYTLTTTSSTYPTNAAGIGMRSSASNSDTYLYECGTIVAYTPGGTTAVGAGSTSLWVLRATVGLGDKLLFNERSVVGKASNELWTDKDRVGKGSAELWTDKLRVGAGSSEVWAERGAVGAGSRSLYNDRACVGHGSTSLYNQYISAGYVKANTLWSLTQRVGAGSSEVWAERGAVGAHLTEYAYTLVRVGSGSSSVYTGRQRVGTGSQSLWSDRGLIGVASAELWASRARVGVGGTSLWLDKARVGDGPALVYTENQRAGAGSQELWGEAARVGAGSKELWADRGLVGTGSSSLWLDRALVGSRPSLLWTDTVRVGAPSSELWSGAVRVGHGVSSPWSATARAGNGTSSLWSDRALVGAGSAELWNVYITVQTPVGQAVLLLWNELVRVGGGRSLLYSDIANVGRGSRSLWSENVRLGSATNSLWNLRAPVRPSSILVWSERAVSGDNLGLAWAEHDRLLSAKALRWNDLVRCGNPIAALYAERALAGSHRSLLWLDLWVAELVKRLNWSVADRVATGSSLLWSDIFIPVTHRHIVAKFRLPIIGRGATRRSR